MKPQPQRSVAVWFDPNNVAHITAYEYFKSHASWPPDFQKPVDAAHEDSGFVRLIIDTILAQRWSQYMLRKPLAQIPTTTDANITTTLDWIVNYLVEERFPQRHLEAIARLVGLFNNDRQTEHAIFEFINTLNQKYVGDQWTTTRTQPFKETYKIHDLLTVTIEFDGSFVVVNFDCHYTQTIPAIRLTMHQAEKFLEFFASVLW